LLKNIWKVEERHEVKNLFAILSLPDQRAVGSADIRPIDPGPNAGTVLDAQPSCVASKVRILEPVIGKHWHI
jgi:hypothetical protein